MKVFVYRTYHILSHGGLQFLLMKLEIDYHTGNYMPYPFR